MIIRNIFCKNQIQFDLLKGIRRNDYSSVLKALKFGANPNQGFPLHQHPMQECVEFADDVRILDALLQYGGDPTMVIPFDGGPKPLDFVAKELNKSEMSERIRIYRENNTNYISNLRR